MKKTDEELKQLARDICNNLVFTTRHLKPGDSDLLSMIFIPLGFMDENDMDELRVKFKAGKLGMLYEYNSRALPRCINGYSMLTSMFIMEKEESDKVWEYVHKIDEAMRSI